LSIQLQSPYDLLRDIRDRFKARRLTLRLTQAGLAKRAGMSLGSLKRFETSGYIALDSLLKIALVLDCLNDFNTICQPKIYGEGMSLDEILARKKIVKRGRLQ
jgi:transcriptional regulator with XRE-family HTH domain